MLASVYVAAESNTFFLDFAQGRQRKYLEPTRISQEILVPLCKAVEPPSLLNQICTGAQIHVVGVGKYYLKANFIKRILVYCLYGTLCSNRHKNRSMYVSMRKVNHTGSCTAALIFTFNLKKMFYHISFLKYHVLAYFSNRQLMAIKRNTGTQAPVSGGMVPNLAMSMVIICII